MNLFAVRRFRFRFHIRALASRCCLVCSSLVTTHASAKVLPIVRCNSTPSAYLRCVCLGVCVCVCVSERERESVCVCVWLVAPNLVPFPSLLCGTAADEETGMTALVLAATRGYDEVVQALLSSDGLDVDHKLVRALCSSHHSTAPLFFKVAHNLDSRCVLLSDPSTFAARGSQPKHVSKSSIRSLNVLHIGVFQAPKDPQAQKRGETALMAAVQKGHHTIVALLLKAGAAPLLPNILPFGTTFSVL